MFLLKDTPITLFFQNPVAEIWNMGQSIAIGFMHVSIIYFFITVIFLLNAVAFIPLGHLVAKLMLNTDTLNAYSYNLLGSILGIILFTILSTIYTLEYTFYYLLCTVLSTICFLLCILLKILKMPKSIDFTKI